MAFVNAPILQAMFSNLRLVSKSNAHAPMEYQQWAQIAAQTEMTNVLRAPLQAMT